MSLMDLGLVLGYLSGVARALLGGADSQANRKSSESIASRNNLFAPRLESYAQARTLLRKYGTTLQ